MEVTEGLDSFSGEDDAKLPSFLPTQLEQAEQQLMSPYTLIKWKQLQVEIPHHSYQQ